MERVASELPALDIDEVDDIPFDFSAGLHSAETIVQTVVEVTAEREEDATASDMLDGSPAVGSLINGEFFPGENGRIVMQRIKGAGRVDRNVYCLRCSAGLSSGRVLTIAAHMKVRRL